MFRLLLLINLRKKLMIVARRQNVGKNMLASSYKALKSDKDDFFFERT